MANKQLLFRAGAREKILHGAPALADAVRVTLGLRSKSVLSRALTAAWSNAGGKANR